MTMPVTVSPRPRGGPVACRLAVPPWIEAGESVSRKFGLYRVFGDLDTVSDVSVAADLQGTPSVSGPAPGVPEQGQVVEIRGSTWAVALVQEQGLPRSPVDEAVTGLNHVVTLQALDEDRLGEELTVVWELEVGHTITPAQGLPTAIQPEGFDDPNTLAGFVDAMRWGAVTSADDRSFQAPFRSGATVEAYQLEPLRRALSSARTNLLLADDVGLGKTVEAGLVVQELLLRHRARTVMVVCPPSLALKWQDEMRDKFGLDFTIINSERLRDVRRAYGLHANPFLLFPRVIVSLAWLPGCGRSGCCATCTRRRGRPTAPSGSHSTSWWWTRRTMWRRRARRWPGAGAGTRWTRSARRLSGIWRAVASTGCSSPRRRTTGIRNRSPP
jgi:hypothetical protein